MASSTSQSVFFEFFGMITSSLGPTMQFGALLNRIGSAGIGAPVSAAWSAKLRPTAMKLRTSPTQAPMRGEPLDQRQRFGGEGLQLGERSGFERCAGEVGDMRREIAQLAGRVDKAGLLLTKCTVTNQFHVVSPFSIVSNRVCKVRPKVAPILCGLPLRCKPGATHAILAGGPGVVALMQRSSRKRARTRRWRVRLCCGAQWRNPR
jgi:hypothetical protein